MVLVIYKSFPKPLYISSTNSRNINSAQCFSILRVIYILSVCPSTPLNCGAAGIKLGLPSRRTANGQVRMSRTQGLVMLNSVLFTSTFNGLNIVARSFPFFGKFETVLIKWACVLRVPCHQCI